MIFGTNLSTLNIGLMIYGRARWQEAEASRKGFQYFIELKSISLTQWTVSDDVGHDARVGIHLRLEY